MLDESADKTLTLLFTTEVIQVSPFSLLVSALAQMQLCKCFRIKPEIGQQKNWLIVFASKQLLLVKKKTKPQEKAFTRKAAGILHHFPGA